MLRYDRDLVAEVKGHLEFYIPLLSRWTNMLRYDRDLLDEQLTAIRGTTLPNFSLTRRN